MPTPLTFPGVYVEEIKSGVRTITGVATSIAAFVGGAERGPVNDPTTVNGFADYQRIFGGLSLAFSMGFAVRDFFFNGGAQAIIVRVIAADAVAATISVPTGQPAPDDVMHFVAASPGVFGNTLHTIVDPPMNLQDPDSFNLTVFEGDTNELKSARTVEKFLGLSVNAANPRFAPRVLEQSSSLVRVITTTPGGTDWVFPGLPPKFAAGSSGGIATSSDNKGTAGTALTSVAFTGGEADKTGIFALEKADIFNLLCIPSYTKDGGVNGDVIPKAIEYCQARRAMFLVDPPVAWKTHADAINQKGGIDDLLLGRSANAALFFPRLTEPNPLRDNQPDNFVPCGAVAGIFARTDAQRGVWKAPAGMDATLSGVMDLSVHLTDAENGQLNPLAVNCLRTFPVVGTVVWGSRTTKGADVLSDDYKYVPVRRLALFIEESLFRGTKWVVFEPNDEPLWAQIRLNIGAFMHNLFRQGAFQGTTPNDAYFVKCDKESTTQNDINLGIVNIVVGFAPLKPAEFVVIKLQQMAGQIDV
jgi:phage tail sheath protein FI